MNCIDLFDRPTDEFIREFHNSAVDRLVVFLHIPKTAGSSIQRDLGCAFKNGYRVDWENVRESWEQFVALHACNPFHHVRGHLSSFHLHRLDQNNIDYQAVSFLRHPIRRLLSNYRYCISDQSPRQAINRAQYQNLHDFMDDCVTDNHMTQLLVGKCDNAWQAIKKISRRFSFIGLQEHYDFCQSILLGSLGSIYRPLPKLNVTPKCESTLIDDLTPAILDRIKETQQIDLEVFDFFHHRYTALLNSVQRLAS